MPILDMQISMRELGRIRTGELVAGSKGRRPAKLDTFRLTTSARELLDAAVELYGGTVEPWESPAGKEWQLKTTVDALPVVIPPGESLSQWYELWSGGGCQRRCDGHIETISDTPCGSQPTRLDGGKVVAPCPGDPADRREAAQAGEACKPTTRLNVILPELPDLGVWRLESHGFYAAVELAAAARFLAIASSSGLNIPARLRLDQREKRVPGRPTNRYSVPIIEFTTTRITDLLAAGANSNGHGALGAAAMAQLPASTTGQTIDPGPAPKRQRTARPPLGAAPGTPDGSTFRKPTPPAATVPPAVAAGSTEEPDTVAGFVVEGEVVAAAAPPAPDPDPATVDTTTGEIVEPMKPLSRPQLYAALEEIGIEPAFALERSIALYPRERNVPLTDAQRGELVAVLAREQSAAALEAAL